MVCLKIDSHQTTSRQSHAEEMTRTIIAGLFLFVSMVCLFHAMCFLPEEKQEKGQPDISCVEQIIAI